MAKPEYFTLYCIILLQSAVLTLTGSQYQGSHYLPYGTRLGGSRHGGRADGPHVGGQEPGQFPPPKRPPIRPPKKPSRPVVTPRPVAPVDPAGAPREPVNPVLPVAPVNPVNPANPANPNPVPTGVAGSPLHTVPPAPTEEYPPVIPVTARGFLPRPGPRPDPRPHPRVTETSTLTPCSVFQPNQCSNHGYCIRDPIFQIPKCQCRDLYAGVWCEIVLKPPQNITMVDVSSDSVSISWKSPPVVTKKITGFVVQYNKFGDPQTRFSPNIHPGVTAYTLRDLEAESQYTICINIIFKNISTKGAVLRDQCLEIRTQPDKYREEGISLTFMAMIIGGVVLALLCIMVIALLIQRRCLKPMQKPMRTIQRAISRRSIPTHRHQNRNANQHNHLCQPPAVTSARGQGAANDQEAEACVKVHRIPPGNPGNPFMARLHTNNANNAAYKDWALPVSVNYSRLQVPDIQPPRYSRSSSCSHALDLTQQCPPRSRTSRERTELSTFGHHRKMQDLRSSRSVPPHASIRALPLSVSNHVMRSKNAREKDASSEFDMRGTYMYFSGPNSTA